jgi:TolA-binding protein
MTFFGKNRNRVIDLSAHFEKQKERTEQMRNIIKENSSPEPNAFSFLGNLASSGKENSNSFEKNEPYVNFSESYEEKKGKLAKRLLDMTNKIEDLSNQIYHLQQRIELLEKKANVRQFN